MADNNSVLLQKLNKEKLALAKKIEAAHEGLASAKEANQYEAAGNRLDELQKKAKVLDKKIKQTRTLIRSEAGVEGWKTQDKTRAAKDKLLADDYIYKKEAYDTDAEINARKTNTEIDDLRYLDAVNEKEAVKAYKEQKTQADKNKAEQAQRKEVREQKQADKKAQAADKQARVDAAQTDIAEGAYKQDIDEKKILRSKQVQLDNATKQAEALYDEKQSKGYKPDSTTADKVTNYVDNKMQALKQRNPDMTEYALNNAKNDFIQEAQTRFGISDKTRTQGTPKPEVETPKAKWRKGLAGPAAGWTVPVAGALGMDAMDYDVGLTELGGLSAAGYGVQQGVKHGTGALKRAPNIASGLTLAGMGLYDGEIDATDLGYAGAAGVLGAGVQSTHEAFRDDPETRMERYDRNITQVDDKGRVVDWKNKVSGADASIPTEEALVAKKLEAIRKGPRATQASKVKLNKPLALASGLSGIAALGARDEIMGAADWMQDKGSEYDFIPGADYMQEAGEFLEGLGIAPGGLTGVLVATLASKYGMDKVRNMYNYNPEIPGGMSKAQARSKFVADIKQATGDKFSQYKDEIVGFKQDAFTSPEQKQANRIARESRQEIRDLQKAQRFTDPAQATNIARNERIARGLDPEGVTGGTKVDYSKAGNVQNQPGEFAQYDQPTAQRNYVFGSGNRTLSSPRVQITETHSPAQRTKIASLEANNNKLASSLRQFNTDSREYDAIYKQIQSNLDNLNTYRVGDAAVGTTTTGEKVNQFWDADRAGKINTAGDLLDNKVASYEQIKNTTSKKIRTRMENAYNKALSFGDDVDTALNKAFTASNNKLRGQWSQVENMANEVKGRLDTAIAQGAQVLDEGIQAPEKKGFMQGTRDRFNKITGRGGKSEVPIEGDLPTAPKALKVPKEPSMLRKGAGSLARGSGAVGKYGMGPEFLWNIADVARGAYESDDAGQYLQETGSDIVDQIKLAGRDYMSMYDQGEYGAMLGKATDEMIMQPLEGGAKVLYNTGAMGLNYLADDQDMLPIADMERRGFSMLGDEGQYGDKWNEQDFHASEMSDEVKAIMTKPRQPGTEGDEKYDKPVEGELIRKGEQPGQPTQQPGQQQDPMAAYHQQAEKYGAKFQGFQGNTPIFVGPDGTMSDTASGAVWQKGPDQFARQQQINTQKAQQVQQAQWNAMTPQQQMQMQKMQYDMRNDANAKRMAQYDRSQEQMQTELQAYHSEDPATKKAARDRRIMMQNSGYGTPAQSAVSQLALNQARADNTWGIPFVSETPNVYTANPTVRPDWTMNPTSWVGSPVGAEMVPEAISHQRQARYDSPTGVLPEERKY